MAPSPKPDHHLNLNHLPQISATQPRSGSSTANTSPIEAPAGTAVRSPFGNPGSKITMNSATGTTRSGTGSPSHELGGGRLYSKRAREIQAQEGLAPSVWGPPASGGSTPLRETIPESPSQDGFPDFMPPTENTTQSPARRARAGTVPSRFSPAAPPGLGGTQSFLPKTSRPTPSTSPFRSSLIGSDVGTPSSAMGNSTSALLSRLRAGSMPQQTGYIDGSSPFGSSLFSTSWNNARNRSSTLASVRSADVPESPAQSSFSKEGLADTDVKTLDYLGLAETPRQNQVNFVQPGMQRMNLQPFLNDLAGYNRNLSRFRSYSVNAKEKYAEDDEDYPPNGGYSGQQSGVMTPMDAAIAQTNAQIIHHNLAVQAFASQASANRPRARTAGVLDSPLRTAAGPLRYLTRPQQINSPVLTTDWSEDYEGLPEAVQALHLNGIGQRSTFETSDDTSQDVPTRALWLGNIPTSTTVTSLQAIFGVHGKIESARVLMHKNCGFVNFEHTECAIKAKSSLNGKEIFPGAGPVRIGYAKAPSASTGGTPGNNFQSRSPDPYTNGQTDIEASQTEEDLTGSRQVNGVHAQSTAAALEVPDLPESKSEMLQMAHEFGASAEDRYSIEDSIDAAINFQDWRDEIPPISEPNHARTHDAPKLREIRKRIDNAAMTQAEIEETAIAMLPEIAELASDYLGNTVVQKLFEFCSEDVKEQMLLQIAPHLAEIGVHKNGTWAAQKIIDVSKTPSQIELIVEEIRPYTVALFLDQYGNYVLQGCLRFGHPYNNFIFETMLSRMWDIAQGRFGARAMRACLESHHATNSQKRMLAAAIALHSVQLATNTNGALLLTWFLDTCTFSHRRAALAPRLVPHLVHLCTHKVAYLTVLKVINQRNEPEARDTVLQALFFSEDDKTLENILSDQVSGATLIFKVLTTPCFDDSQRNDVLQNVRNVLLRLKVTASQGYKRLMDEVGLSGKGNKTEREQTPNGRGTHQERNRTPQHGSRERRNHHMDNERQFSNQYFQSPAQPQYPMQTGFAATTSMDPNGILAYDQLASNFAPNTLNAINQQFQPSLLPRGTSPADVYQGMGFGGYPAPATTMAQLPQQPIRMSPSPMLQQSAFTPPSFNPLMSGNSMAGAYPMPMQYYPQQQHVMQQQDGRRGRQHELNPTKTSIPAPLTGTTDEYQQTRLAVSWANSFVILHSAPAMTSVHTVMPSSLTFDTTLPPKLDINVGATSHFFLPPKTPSASSSLHRSTNTISAQDVSHYPTRKRSRYDSYMSDQATPFSAQSPAWSSISPTTPSLETPEAMSPVPFVSTKYELAGGLDTPAAARLSAMERGDDAEADLHLRGGRGFRGFDLAAESYFPYSAPALARESNGRPRTQNAPRLRDGLGKAVYSVVGVAGRVLEFCKATAFRGFYAGGGQGYEIRPPTQSAERSQGIWLDEESDNELQTFEREMSAVPGGFPEEDFIPEYMSQDHTTPPRAAKKVRRENGTAEVGASWVIVGSNPTSREASPSRLSHRKVPSAYTAPSLQPRPKLARRPILPASRPSQTSFAGSPAMRPDRPASYASSRSPMTSPTKRDSPVSVEVQRHATRMRKREIQEDANLKRFNQQLKAMIKEGKEALGTKFEVEDADDESMDEGYAEGGHFDEKWKG